MWYGAVLVFRSQVSSDSAESALVDEQVRLVQGTDPDEAYRKALDLGKAGEHAYKNAAGQEVVWAFIGLRDLLELDSAPKHGLEVASFLGTAPAEGLVRDKEQLSVFAERNMGQAG